MHITQKTEADTKAKAWFYGTGSEEERLYVYDANGSAIVFKASDYSAIGTGNHASLDLNTTDDKYELTNEGPTGSIRSRGLWAYKFDETSLRITEIIDPSGNVQTISYATSTYNQDVTVTDSTSTGQTLKFEWQSATSLTITRDAGGSPPVLATLTYTSTSPLRVSRVAWAGVPDFDITYKSGATDYVESVDSQLSSSSLEWTSYSGFDGSLAPQRADHFGVSGLEEYLLVPSYPSPRVLQLDGQFNGFDETATTTTHTQPASGPIELTVDLYEPRLNGAADNSDYDHETVLNEDGTIKTLSYRWGNTSPITATYTYNDDGNVTEFEDFRGETWTYAYSTDPIGGAFDSGGVLSSVKLPISVTDPTSITTSWTYDDDPGTDTPDSAITSITLPGGFTTTLGYSETGQLITRLLPGHANPWEYAYNEASVIGIGAGGYLRSVTDPTGNVFEINGYDALGNVTETVVYPDGSTSTPTDIGRDEFGRLTSIRHSDYYSAYANEDTYTYDEATGALTGEKLRGGGGGPEVGIDVDGKTQYRDALTESGKEYEVGEALKDGITPIARERKKMGPSTIFVPKRGPFRPPHR